VAFGYEGAVGQSGGCVMVTFSEAADAFTTTDDEVKIVLVALTGLANVVSLTRSEDVVPLTKGLVVLKRKEEVDESAFGQKTLAAYCKYFATYF
jgi:hypothetical protein